MLEAVIIPCLPRMFVSVFLHRNRRCSDGSFKCIYNRLTGGKRLHRDTGNTHPHRTLEEEAA